MLVCYHYLRKISKNFIVLKMFSFLLLVVLLSFLPISQADGKIATFGEPCNKATRCNSEAFLYCFSHVCQCLKPESMVYDESRGICVAPPGDSCKFDGVEIPKKGEKFPEVIECDRNSHCREEDNICACNDELVLSNNRSCIPNRRFGEACSVEEDGTHNCRPDKYLHCVNSQCSCDEAHAFYDENREECVAREGASCLAYANCVPFAACPFQLTGSYYSSTLCVCQPGFSRSPEGLCLANFGEQCNTKDRKCGRDMMCKSGICECKFAERQKYDRDTNLCVSLVDSPCFIKYKTQDGTKYNMSFPCVKNAECKQVEALHECRCREGFIEGDHTCELSYDQPCGEDIPEPCDRLAPLECIDGRCRCSSEYLYYEVSSQKCKALVGAPCLLGSKDTCTGGAECKPTRNANSKYGQCRCSTGYVTPSNRKCVHHLLIRGAI